jgi:hypothetical protein
MSLSFEHYSYMMKKKKKTDFFFSSSPQKSFFKFDFFFFASPYLSIVMEIETIRLTLKRYRHFYHLLLKAMTKLKYMYII